jgi:hypothetical protein
MPAEPDGFPLNDQEVAKLPHSCKLRAIVDDHRGGLSPAPRLDAAGSARQGGTGPFDLLSEGAEGIERALEALTGPAERLCPLFLDFCLDGVNRRLLHVRQTFTRNRTQRWTFQKNRKKAMSYGGFWKNLAWRTGHVNRLRMPEDPGFSHFSGDETPFVP